MEILILRRLSAGPLHGYELRKRVEEISGVTLHNNTLYPALKRFEDAGAVTKSTEPQPGRPPRLVYQLTDTGRSLLQDMLADLPADLAGDESEFLTRLGQFSLIRPSERVAVLVIRSDAVRARLEHLRRLKVRAADRGERWGEIVTAELIRRDERELEWLSSLREPAAEEP